MASDEMMVKIVAELKHRGYNLPRVTKSMSRERWLLRGPREAGFLVSNRGNVWSIELDHGSGNDWAYGVFETDHHFVDTKDDQNETIHAVVNGIEDTYYSVRADLNSLFLKLKQKQPEHTKHYYLNHQSRLQYWEYSKQLAELKL